MKHLYFDKLRYLVPFFLLFYLFSLPLCSQDISWQRSIGGKQGEYLFDVLSTPDYGSILAGSSVSVKSGNLQHTTQGSLDYFLWKLNEQGHQEWQKSLGGNQADYLYSIGLTQDGGYILGGSSYSGISGNKTDSCRGLDDYWIVKLDARGEIQWQKTLGGYGSDQLLSIKQTSDLGYILGGSSDSPVSSEKKEPSRGSMDFWIIKLDKKGTIIWQKTLGGANYELLKSIWEVPGGYIGAGYSNSPSGFDKSEDSYGENDYWLVRLDNQGTVIWEKSYGGKGNDELADMIVTRDGGFLLAGSSDSLPEGAKSAVLGEGSDIWLIKTDHSGNPIWQQSVDIGIVDIPSRIMETDQGDFLIAGSSLSLDTQGVMQSDYISVKISASGEILWKKKIGGDQTDLLSCAAETRNGSLLLAGTSNSSQSKDKTVDSRGQTDFWVVKLLTEEGQNTETERKLWEIYPNPTERFVNVIISGELNGHENIQVFDMSGKLLQQKTVRYSTTPVDLSGYTPGVYLFSIILPSGIRESIKIIKTGN